MKYYFYSVEFRSSEFARDIIISDVIAAADAMTPIEVYKDMLQQIEADGIIGTITVKAFNRVE